MYQIAKLATSIVEYCSLKWTADCIDLKWFQFLPCKSIIKFPFSHLWNNSFSLQFQDRATIFNLSNNFKMSINWIVATCQLWHISLDICIVKILLTEFKSMLVEPFNPSLKIFCQFLHHSIPFGMSFLARLHLSNGIWWIKMNPIKLLEEYDIEKYGLKWQWEVQSYLWNT